MADHWPVEQRREAVLRAVAHLFQGESRFEPAKIHQAIEMFDAYMAGGIELSRNEVPKAYTIVPINVAVVK